MNQLTASLPAISKQWTAAQTIDGVIGELENILAFCITNNIKAGYFAALYYVVTATVRQDIIDKKFEDNERMERMDVIFANRYLKAWHEWTNGQKTTRSWQIAFETTKSTPAILMQHLLLGINAHINLDLGIAAVEVMKEEDINGLKNDFYNINAVLASLIDRMEDAVTKINPLVKLLALHVTNLDEMLVQFSIDIARDGAWQFAQELTTKSKDDQTNCIVARDQRIAQLATSIANPGLLLRLTVWFIKLFEIGKTGRTIRILKGHISKK